MKKMWVSVVFFLIGSTVIQISCSDNDSNTTTPKKIDGSFCGEDTICFLNNSATLSPVTPQKNINGNHDLPATPLAKRSNLVFGSAEEVAIYEHAKSQRSEEKSLIQQRRKALMIKSLTLEQKEALLQEHNERQVKELQRNRTSAGYCFCCFLGIVLLSDFAADSTSCKTSSCLSPDFKQKMA